MMHYSRVRSTGDPSVVQRAANGTWTGSFCLVEGCEKEADTRGYCPLHYGRLRRWGDPLYTPPRRPRKALQPKLRASRKERHAVRRQLHNRKAHALKTGRGEILKVLGQPKCAICGERFRNDDEKHIDHIIPIAQGGTNDLANLAMTHARCNMTKGAFAGNPETGQLYLTLGF